MSDKPASGLQKARLATLAVCVLAAVVLMVRGATMGPPDAEFGDDLTPQGVTVAGVMILMASLWVLEGMPLAATALLPLVLFPFLDVSPAKDVARTYMSSIVMLLMGGFFMAKSLERWEVPVKLARRVEVWAKGSPTRLMYGLMGVTALLSMWLSNTATTLVMVTVGAAAVGRAQNSDKNDPLDVRRFAVALMLGIAYAANMGGLATPVGTAPNAIFLGMADKEGLEGYSFAIWMILTVPVVLLMLPAIALLLAKVLCPFPVDLDLGSAEEQARPLSVGGRRALGIFVLIALAWVFRKDVDLEVLRIPGWANAIGVGKAVDDGTIAMLGAVLMFATPSGEGERVLTWETARTIPWYLILLFGGGLALADAFSTSGLSAWLGGQLVGLMGAPTLVIVLVLCLGMSLLTEVTSNTATTTLLLPVLAAAAVALAMPKSLLMWPATLCASAAFILPISTPPNAIAAGAGNISVPEMARVGIWMNLIAVVIISIAAVVWMPLFID
jgi:sodium-dependent dicarboxylate transporter 2/3/5